jgi:hypothetical protein
MDLTALAGAICDEADDFLAGASSRAEARAGIAEWLTIRHPKLGAAERRQVTDRVMAILEREGFFEAMPGASPGDGGGIAPDPGQD